MPSAHFFAEFLLSGTRQSNTKPSARFKKLGNDDELGKQATLTSMENLKLKKDLELSKGDSLPSFGRAELSLPSSGRAELGKYLTNGLHLVQLTAL